MGNLPVAGDVIAGKYRVERVIGQGGMGVVLAAVHLQLEERVALKLVLHEVATPEGIARFLREGKAAVKIRSEHVARVLDVGTLENGAPFMVMEYLEGSDLGEVLRSSGALSIATAVGYLLQACEALAEAHALGIVHRDLKPPNLFLSQRADGSPCIKVLDFGISKGVPSSAPDAAMTRTTAVMGSPCYMSPEQWRSARDVDARADVWALGAILHELLTGRAAFEAPTIPTLYVAISEHPPQPLRQIRPDAPAGLEAAIQRCLEKVPDRRYPNVAAFAEAIVDFGPSDGRTSVERIARVLRVPVSRPADRVASISAAPTVLGPPMPAPSVSRPPPSLARHVTKHPAVSSPAWMWLVALLVIAALSVVTVTFGVRWWLLRRAVAASRISDRPGTATSSTAEPADEEGFATPALSAVPGLPTVPGLPHLGPRSPASSGAAAPSTSPPK